MLRKYLSEVVRRIRSIHGPTCRGPADVCQQNVGPNLLEWPERAAIAARILHEWRLCGKDIRVVDYGCGRQTMRKLLPRHWAYLPVDNLMRSPDTHLCDFNDQKPPVHFDVAICLGVLEYLRGPLGFLRHIVAGNSFIVFSYNGRTTAKRRFAQGWANDLPFEDIERTIASAKGSILQVRELGKNERCYFVRGGRPR